MRSDGLMREAWILTRTSPCLGLGMGTSTSERVGVVSGEDLDIWTAFIVDDVEDMIRYLAWKRESKTTREEFGKATRH